MFACLAELKRVGFGLQNHTIEYSGTKNKIKPKVYLVKRPSFLLT